MTTAPPPYEIAERLYTVEEWLEFEKHADVRHEYFYGKLIPMAGESKRANVIAGNIKRHIDVPLYQKGIQVYDHDVKAEVVSNGIYRYPDLVAAPVADDEHDYIVKHPVLMVEVASESSGNRDRVKKRQAYQKIALVLFRCGPRRNAGRVAKPQQRGQMGNIVFHRARRGSFARTLWLDFEIGGCVRTDKTCLTKHI
jgi:Uma2 family endonuclease